MQILNKQQQGSYTLFILCRKEAVTKEIEQNGEKSEGIQQNGKRNYYYSSDNTSNYANLSLYVYRVHE